MMLLLSTLIACQVMDNPGHVFTSVAIAEETDKTDSTSQEGQDGASDKSLDKAEDKAVDPLFGRSARRGDSNGVDALTEEPVETTSPSVATASEEGDDTPETVEVSEAQPATQPVMASSSFGPATVKDGWRPTLIGTLMDGPTPRAILAMPSGEEKVVKAGDMLADDGVVVMTIGNKFIELAVIRSAEGRAQIENLTLSTQF